MSLRCKVGDLAVVVRSVTDPQCVGSFVGVIAPAGGDVVAPDGTKFVDADDGLCYWLVKHRGGGPSPNTDYAVWADKCLRPIRPGADPESITTDEVLEVGV